jgi:hypothetical protein
MIASPLKFLLLYLLLFLGTTSLPAAPLPDKPVKPGTPAPAEPIGLRNRAAEFVNRELKDKRYTLRGVEHPYPQITGEYWQRVMFSNGRWVLGNYRRAGFAVEVSYSVSGQDPKLGNYGYSEE